MKLSTDCRIRCNAHDIKTIVLVNYQLLSAGVTLSGMRRHQNG